MTGRRLAILVLAALALAACGPSRGVRLEKTGESTNPVEPGSAFGSIRIKSVMTVVSPPYGLTLEGHTIWAAVHLANHGEAIQAVDVTTAQERGIVDLRRRLSIPVALASTSKVIWLLTTEQGRSDSRLERIGSRVEPARSAADGTLSATANSLGTLEPVASFPRTTFVLGATPSAVWLLSYRKDGFTLWRCDASTLRLRRFALTSGAFPSVAMTPQRVFVLLPEHGRRAVSIETRDASGRLISRSPRIRIAGQLAFPALSACGSQIVGFVYRHRSLVALRLNADGSHPTYSSDLSLSARTNPNADFVAASTFGDRCRSIWLAASNQTYPGPATGFVRRLDTATLKSTGRIDNIVASGLLWAHGSLWVADTEHAAILRIGSAVTRASR